MELTKDIKDKLLSFAYSDNIEDLRKGIKDTVFFINQVEQDYYLRKLQLSRQSQKV